MEGARGRKNSKKKGKGKKTKTGDDNGWVVLL